VLISNSAYLFGNIYPFTLAGILHESKSVLNEHSEHSLFWEEFSYSR